MFGGRDNFSEAIVALKDTHFNKGALSFCRPADIFDERIIGGAIKLNGLYMLGQFPVRALTCKLMKRAPGTSPNIYCHYHRNLGADARLHYYNSAVFAPPANWLRKSFVFMFASQSCF